jgi:MbtH protein
MAIETGTKDATPYRAVVNDEGQYAIWPAEKAIPLGWTDAGASGAPGPKDEVLRYIESVWTDMRPRSIRR